MKVIYQSEGHLVLYICHHVAEEGHCTNGLQSVYVLSSVIDDTTLADDSDYLSAIRQSCLQPGDFISVNKTVFPGKCSHIPDSGNSDSLPSQKHFDPQRFTGVWYALLREKGHSLYDGIKMTIKETVHNILDVTTVATRSGQCLPPLDGQFVVPSSGSKAEMYASFGDVKGHIRVLYTDYDYALIYECFEESLGGGCVPGRGLLILYGRSVTDNLTLPDSVTDTTRRLLIKASLDIDGLDQMDHSVDCPFEAHIRQECLVRNIRTEDNFDMAKFLGTWYSLYRLRDQHALKHFSAHFYYDLNGKVKAIYTGVSNGSCITVKDNELKMAEDGGAILQISNYDTVSMIKVIYTDYTQYSVLYTCTKIETDGSCDRSRVYLDVLSRDKYEPSDKVKRELLGLVKMACFEPGDMMENNFDDQCQLNTDVTGSVREMPIPQIPLDSRQFEGVWHSVAKVYGSSDPDSVKLVVRLSLQGGFSLIYYPQRNGRCLTRYADTVTPCDERQPSVFCTSGGGGFAVYTDGTLAQTVLCSRMDPESGRCQSRPDITVWLRCSRDPCHVSPERIQRLIQTVGGVPLPEDSWFWTPHQIECDTRRVQCPVTNLHTRITLDMRLFTGVWTISAVNRPIKLWQSSPLIQISQTANKSFEMLFLRPLGKDQPCHTARPIAHSMKTVSADRKDEFIIQRMSSNIRQYWRILWTDYERALVFACEIDADQNCVPGSDTASVFTRTHDLNDLDLQQILDQVDEKHCFALDDFYWTPRLLPCPMPSVDTLRVCNLDTLPTQRDLSPDQLTGTWYVNYRHRNTPDRGSSLLKYKLMEDGNIKLLATGYLDGQCLPTTVVDYLKTAEHYQWQIKSAPLSNGFIHVLYLDRHMAMMYKCILDTETNNCQPGSAFVDVLGRDRNRLLGHSLDIMLDILQESCFDPGEFVYVPHYDDCDVTDPDTVHCDLDQLPSQDHFIADQFTGIWKAIYRTPGAGFGESSKFKFKADQNGTYTSLITSSRRGRCMSTTIAQYSDHSVFTANSSDLYGISNQHTYRTRILYTDYMYSLLYTCTRLTADESCEPGASVLTVYSRTNEVPDTVMEYIVSILGDTCTADGELFERLLLEDHCQVAEPDRDDCHVNKLPLAETFDVQQFTGRWYGRYALRGGSIYRQSHQILVHVVGENRLLITHSYHDGTQCRQVSDYLTASDTPGLYHYVMIDGYQDEKVILKVTDMEADSYMMVYKCSKMLPNGMCDYSQRDVTFYTRTNDDVTSYVSELKRAAWNLCTEPGDYYNVSLQESCTLIPPKPLRCAFEEMPHQKEFSMTEFTGTWYAVRRLTGTPIPDSLVMRIEETDGNWKLVYTGLVSGRCLVPRPISLTYTETGLVNMIYNEQSKGIFKVLYTDYSTALVYWCTTLLDPVHCVPGEDSLVVYTRSVPQSDDILEHLDRVLDTPCYTKTDMELVSRKDVCKLPVSNACLVSNIPTERNFNINKFQGTWYSLYHLRADSSSDGFTLHVSRDPDHVIRLYNTASGRHGCRTGIREIDDPEDDNVASWILDKHEHSGVFKVIATDYYHGVIYKCREIADDGTCKPGHEFIDVIGRVKRLPSETIRRRLFTSAMATCKQRGEFLATDLSINCPMSLKVQKKCKFDDIPVVKNFDVNKFEGVWHVYASLRNLYGYNSMTTAVKSGPNGSLMFVHHPSSEGRCLDSFEEILQPSDDKNTADFIHSKGRVRIVYTDYNYALLIGCRQIADDGTCVPGQSTAVVCSRTQVVPLQSRHLILEAVKQSCLSESDIIVNSHQAVCEVAYSGRRSCRFEDILSAEDFTFDKIYGTWHLLAKTGTEKVRQTVMKLMMAHNDTMRYALAERLLGKSCFNTIVYVKTNHSTPATYSYQLGNRNALVRVIHVTSSYLIQYVCSGSVLDIHGVCPTGRDHLEVWGRTSLPTGDLVQQLLSNTAYRTCVNVETYTTVPSAGIMCKLPISTCDIYKFVEADSSDLELVYGGWQLISRTLLVRTKAVSKSIIYFADDQTGELRYGAAGNLNNGACYKTNGVYKPDPRHNMTYISEGQNGEPVITRILYVTKDHLITISCTKSPDEHGVCYYGNTQLDIYGKSSADPDVREKLIQIAKHRTLDCVPTVAMMDVPSNDNCQIEAEYCSSKYFQIQDGYDQRSFYGKWYVVMRTTFLNSQFISQTIIYSHRPDNRMEYTSAVLSNTGQCRRFAGVVDVVRDGQSASYHFVDMSGSAYDFKVLYVSPQHLVTYHCFEGWDDAQCCPLERTSVVILSRDDHLQPKDINNLQKLIRQVTLSCIPTSMFVTVRPSDCDIDKPEGRQSCTLDDIKEVKDLDPQKLVGVWYQIARSDISSQRADSKLDGVMMKIRADNDNLIYTVTGYFSGERNQCIPDTSFVTSFKSGKAGLQEYKHNKSAHVRSILKVIYVDDDHFISYRCYNVTQTLAGLCPRQHQSVNIYSRRKSVNEVNRRHFVNFLLQETCLMKHDLIVHNKTVYCQLRNTEIKRDQKKCRVDEIPVQENFNQDKFVGLWYEVERTRFTPDNVWESIVSHFDSVHELYMRLMVSGTRSGQCMGPFEAHISRQTDQSGDMTMWIGSRDAYGHPWTVKMRYKVVYTDYQTAVVYTCRHVSSDGTCPRKSQQVDILSRQRDLDPEATSRLMDIIKNKLCLSPADFVVPAQEADCLEFVRPAAADPEDVILESPSPDPDRCPRIQCSLYCRHGFEKDADGCDVCQCSTVNSTQSSDTVLCTVSICPIYCLHGYKKDEHGCDTCQCVEINTPEVTRLERKLEELPSKSMQCTVPKCTEQCQHGYVHNEYGCMTCECKKQAPEDTSKPVDRSTTDYPCAIPMCSEFCEHGYVYNSHGCMTCQCKEIPTDIDMTLLCRPIQCSLTCEHGFDKDQDGCDICRCLAGPDQLNTEITMPAQSSSQSADKVKEESDQSEDQVFDLNQRSLSGSQTSEPTDSSQSTSTSNS